MTNADGDELFAVLQELRPLEPVFHTAAFGSTPAEFAQRMSDDYWEIGASGRRYDRTFILQHLQANPPLSAEQQGWHASDHAVRRLSTNVYLLTYILQQNDRFTRRSTIWQRTSDGWQILYHQGTLMKHSG